MTSLYRLGRKVGIRTVDFNLWNRTLVTKHGSVLLSHREHILCTGMLLRPGISYTDMLELVWPNPHHEPGSAEDGIRAAVHNLGKKLTKVGARVNRQRLHCEGKRLEMCQ